MTAFNQLIRCAGTWQGKSVLQDPPNRVLDESASTLSVIPVLAGQFVRLDYTWGYRGKPQEGSLLIGHIAAENAFTAHWVDTWHMADKVLASRGPAGDVFSVLGHYA